MEEPDTSSGSPFYPTRLKQVSLSTASAIDFNPFAIQINALSAGDPSGAVDVLTYEIEFLSKGKKHERIASPDGVIPHLWKPISEKDLPKAVADTGLSSRLTDSSATVPNQIVRSLNL